ncbi:MAG: DUF6262 family protein [Chloroflexota bacterium]
MSRADNTPFLRAAAARRHQDMVARTLRSLERMVEDDEYLTIGSLAAAAGVSRAWLYQEPNVRGAIEQARATLRTKREQAPRSTHSDASKDARMRLLWEENQRLRGETQTLKARLGELLGQVRELTYARGIGV